MRALHLRQPSTNQSVSFGSIPTRVRQSNRKGIAATEFALILPFLLFIALATLDFGRGIRQLKVVSNAARVGAEYAATHRFTPYTQYAWETQIRQAVIEELEEITNNGTSPESQEPTITSPEPTITSPASTITITVVDTGDAYQRVAVEVEYQFDPVLDWPGLGDAMQLRRKIWVRQYR